MWDPISVVGFPLFPKIVIFAGANPFYAIIMYYPFVIVSSNRIVLQPFHPEIAGTDYVYYCSKDYVVMAWPDNDNTDASYLGFARQQCRLFVDAFFEITKDEHLVFNKLLCKYHESLPTVIDLGGKNGFKAIIWAYDNTMTCIESHDTRYYDTINRGINFYSCNAPYHPYKDEMSCPLFGEASSHFHQEMVPLMERKCSSFINIPIELSATVFIYQIGVPRGGVRFGNEREVDLLDKRPDFETMAGNLEYYRKYLGEKTMVGWIYEDIQKQIDSPDIDRLETMVLFVKENEIYPDLQRMEEVFNAAFGLYKAVPEEVKARINNICWDLKEMLLILYKKKK